MNNDTKEQIDIITDLQLKINFIEQRLTTLETEKTTLSASNSNLLSQIEEFVKVLNSVKKISGDNHKSAEEKFTAIHQRLDKVEVRPYINQSAGCY